MAVQGDPFRRNYGTLNDQQKEDMEATKITYEIVWAQLERMSEFYVSPRDLAIAKTHLQDSCMWAVRAITRAEDQS